jgi:hypothetical protein
VGQDDGAAARPTAAQGAAPRKEVSGLRYRLEVRLTAADVGRRVVIRWRRPGPDGSEQIADVLGILEDHDAQSFAVRTRDGQLAVIPTGRALAGKVVPPPPVRRRRAGPSLPDRHTPRVARTCWARLFDLAWPVLRAGIIAE